MYIIGVDWKMNVFIRRTFICAHKVGKLVGINKINKRALF